MKIILSHRIRLYPTVKQRRYFLQACGTNRFVWNWALAEWNKQYDTGTRVKGVALKRQFNAIKYKQFPWLANIHRDAHSQPFAELQRAFVRFFKHKAKHPVFHKRGRKDSFYVANDKFSIDGKHIKLPKVGAVKLAESLRFNGKKMAAVVSQQAGKWFVSVAVEITIKKPVNKSKRIIGVDLGVKNAITLSDGTQMDGPKPLKRNLKALARESRRLSKKQKGSSNRAKAKFKISRLHARIGNIRKDFLNKITTNLCRENQAVVIEDLNVSGMVQNHKLARAISDMGFGEFKRQMQYKSAMYGTKLITASRWFPSSKMCCVCGALKEGLKMSDRTYVCQCGNVMDRDINAAKNLATLGYRGSAATRIVKSGVAKPVDMRIRPACEVALMDEAGIATCAHKCAQGE